MAAASSNLTTQLEKKLSDENEPLSSRLDVALTVFSSSDIPIVQKEEYVLAWALKNLSVSSESVDKERLYSFLYKCLQCKRFRTLHANMKTTVIEELFSALKTSKEYPDSIRSIIRSCCVEIFEISFFQRWFMCDPENVCRIVCSYIRSVNDLNTASQFCKVIDHFLYIHKMSLLKVELRTHFVKGVLKPMCEALSNIPHPERKSYFEKAIFCCREVILYESKFLEGYIALSKSKEEEQSKEVKSFSKKIRHMPTKESKEVVEICYSLLLRTIILKYPDEYEKVFRFFISLCPPLGIVVNRMFSIELNPVENWDIDNSFEIIAKLIDILDDSKIPLIFQLEEISLQNWFTSMVIGLSNINTKNFSGSFLKMIKRVYEFNPLVIEPSCKVITMIMLQIKNPNVRIAYVELIQSVLGGSSKLQRLQKFIAFFLENMRDYLRTSFCEENLLLEDVLPPGTYNDFTSAFSALPSMQVLGMMRSFTFHLERDCLNELESSSDKVLIINYGVICELLTILLLSANIIDYSVPENVKTKYKLLLEDLQVLLKLMGNIFQDIHEDRLLKPFFKLCRAFGEVKLLFREYDNIEIVPPMEIDLEPTNISYVHNYLDPDCWGRIAQSIEVHDHCQAANYFYELLIQKVGAVSQVEEGSEGPGTQVARYLLSHAETDWLFEKVLKLAPLFQSAELAKLISKIVRYLGDDQSDWLPLLKEEAFTENRRLVLGLAFCLMYRTSKMCGSEEEEEREPVSKQVLSLVSPKDLLEYELSQLIVDDEELREVVDGSLNEMASILNENLPLLHIPSQNSSHISLFEVPARLPLHHLSSMSQSCALMSATALLYDLPPGSEADMLLFNLLLKILDGPQKNTAGLLSDLNLDSFLKFVAIRGKDYRGQRKLMKRICMHAFRSKKSAKHLFREVDEPSVSDVWITALVIDCLVQLKKKFIGSKEAKKPLERKKCLDHLLNAVLPVICSEPASPSLLYTFTIVFNHTLRYHSSYQEHFNQLVSLLEQYIGFALSDYREGERLVEGVVEHRNELGEHFPSSLILATFNEMQVQIIPPSDSTSHMLFGSATASEFKTILSQMLEKTKLEDLESMDFKSSRLLLLWSHLLSSLLNSEKCHDRNETLMKLMEHLVLVSKPWINNSAQHLVTPLMRMLTTLSKNSGIELRGSVLDSCLELCGVVPLPQEDCELVLTNLEPLLDALLSLYRHRTALLTDRLPAFLQRYRRCLFILPKVVTKSSPYLLIKRAVPLANKMERLATTMIKRPKDMSRLAPYLIADLMNIYQLHDIPGDIKFAYDNVINAFLSISDKHAISYLKGILPTGQQELFNGVYENFNKFHRFVGKI